jgi:AbrB family looped-hinge helix DNA binding protein
MMQSVITAKFQTTIPKTVRKNLKLSTSDSLEWRVEKGKVIVTPVQRNFSKYKNAIKTGGGDITADIQQAKTERLEKYR